MKKTMQVLKRKARQIDAATQDVTAGARKNGRRLWLVGLGALSTAQKSALATLKDLRQRDFGKTIDETVKSVRRVGDRVGGQVLKGVSLPKTELASLGEVVETAAAKAVHLGTRVRVSVEKGVESTLGQLGVPTRREVRHLVHRVEQLTEKVDQLAHRRRPAPRRRAPRAVGA